MTPAKGSGVSVTWRDVLEGEKPCAVVLGDCREVLAEMPDSSVDAVVCDPPYDLNFLGKAWDRTGVAFDAATWRIVARVCKPGAHIVAFGGTRTWHRLACAIEDAGLQIRDTLCWLHGTGFPKSLDASKAIDAHLGAERAVVGQRLVSNDGLHYGPSEVAKRQGLIDVTAPATEQARHWNGWGTALKPAWEPVILARRPLDGTLAKNLLRWGVGALNIDGCRLATMPTSRGNTRDSQDARLSPAMCGPKRVLAATYAARLAAGEITGRWPPNVALSHLPGCEVVGTKRVRGNRCSGIARGAVRVYGGGWGDRPLDEAHYADDDGTEEVEDWRCAEGCPIRMLDEQTGERPGMAVTFLRRGATTGRGIGYQSSSPGAWEVEGYGDIGGASRFFYCAPSNREEREAGLDGMERRQRDGSRAADAPGRRANHHPTVKAAALLRWLHGLVCPPGGVILDPFAGSGSGGVAAAMDGMRWIGIEREREYVTIARLRIENAAPLFLRVDKTNDATHGRGAPCSTSASDAERRSSGEGGGQLAFALGSADDDPISTDGANSAAGPSAPTERGGVQGGSARSPARVSPHNATTSSRAKNAADS